MTLTPLPLGQIRPTGPVAARLLQVWDPGLPEGSASWVRHALLVGGGKGKLVVRAWAKARDPDALSLPGALEPLVVTGTAWADEFEARFRSDEVGLDELVVRQVWAEPTGLRVAFYSPATVKTEVAGVPVALEFETEYPENPRVEVRLYPETSVEFTLAFRIPAWASGCLLTGDGASGADAEDRDGWIELRRAWNRGDTLNLTFDLNGLTKPEASQ